uniref:Uncharacterized protein n=1 Tax=Eptatretus burgeri TaxID=7764 RepID=A0A8C4QGR7_EPTBU
MLAGHVSGRGQSKRPIRVMMFGFSMASPPPPVCRTYKGRGSPSCLVGLCFLLLASVYASSTPPRPAACSSTPPPHLRPHHHDPPPAPRLHHLISAHTTSTPTTDLIPPTTPPSPSGLRPFSTEAPPSRTQPPHMRLGPETTCPLSGTTPRSIASTPTPLKRIGGTSCYRTHRYRDHSLNSPPRPPWLQNSLIGFSVSVCVHWRLSASVRLQKIVIIIVIIFTLYALCPLL